jgi:hypothetical protein
LCCTPWSSVERGELLLLSVAVVLLLLLLLELELALALVPPCPSTLRPEREFDVMNDSGEGR